MKNAIILHGTSCTPNSYWQPKIKEFLESRGYEVWVPSLPNPDYPDLEVQLPFVLEKGVFNENTILIGHFAGAPLILAILEKINKKIDKAILIAGYARPKGENSEPEKILKEKYNWEKIKNNVKDITFINSDNDPWGCNDSEGKYMFDNAGGRLIILHGEGHMGSDQFSQPYKEFPLIEKLIEM
ncbi:MAG: alpha/beta hydrolase [archaeon]